MFVLGKYIGLILTVAAELLPLVVHRHDPVSRHAVTNGLCVFWSNFGASLLTAWATCFSILPR